MCMKIFVLPGYSVTNREWAYEVRSKLMPDFAVQVHEWTHWIGGNTGFDVDIEAVRIIDSSKGEDKIDIIAKSIGTLVTMKVLKVLENKVRKIILCGIPLNDLQEEDFAVYKILNGISRSENIVCFQNSDDPHGNYQQVFNFLDNINPKIKINVKGGNTHDYPYYEEFFNFLKN